MVGQISSCLTKGVPSRVSVNLSLAFELQLAVSRLFRFAPCLIQEWLDASNAKGRSMDSREGCIPECWCFLHPLIRLKGRAI